MRICSYQSGDDQLAGIRNGEFLIPVFEINKYLKTDFPVTLEDLILQGRFSQLVKKIQTEDVRKPI